MAYTPLDAISVGDPVKKDEYDRISDNFEDHESRINLLESGTSRIQIFDTMVVSSIATVTVFPQSIQFYRAPADFSIIGSTLSQLTIGSGGTLQVDVLLGNSINGVFTSIYSVKPSLTPGNGVGAESTGTLNPTSVTAGQYLRLDITSTQTSQKQWFFHLFGEGS